MNTGERRTLNDALTNASRIAHELSRLVQPEPIAYDMITLANEVYRLRAELTFAVISMEGLCRSVNLGLNSSLPS